MKVNDKVWCTHHGCYVTITDMNEGSPSGQIGCQFEDGRSQAIPKVYLTEAPEQTKCTTRQLLLAALVIGHKSRDRWNGEVTAIQFEDGSGTKFNYQLGNRSVWNFVDLSWEFNSTDYMVEIVHRAFCTNPIM